MTMVNMGGKNIFSHLIFIENPSGKETGRKMNIPTFCIFTGMHPLVGILVICSIKMLETAHPMCVEQACSFLPFFGFFWGRY